MKVFALGKDTKHTMAQSRYSFSRSGCVLLLVGLLLLIGTVSYVAAGLLGAHLPGFEATQPPITIMPINSSFPYAGVDLTIVNAQQANSFLDDPNTSTDGMVRLKMQAANKTPISISWNYANIAQLILPGKTIVKPVYVNAPMDIAPGKMQMNIVDFAVPDSDTIAQLTLRVGTANEAQMDIPLTGKADLSVYAPKTTPLNGQMLYFGLNWTLKSATTSLSIPGQQAARGMRYLTLMLSVDNTLSQVAITGSPYDYARLQFGNTTIEPRDSTLPVSFNTGVSNITGTLSFLIPQKSTAFTLLFLAQGQNSTDQATTAFQLM